jgi:hypothetical protein
MPRTNSNEAQVLPPVGGKVTSDDPFNAQGAVALRHLADAHAIRLAKGEQKIKKLDHGFNNGFAHYLKERVDLERRQCELLLKLEDDVPFGSRSVWKFELAGSLSDNKLRLGTNYSVSGIETRLTIARLSRDNPGIWVEFLAHCHVKGRPNFRKFLASLKPKSLAEHQNDVQDEIDKPGPKKPDPPVATEPVPVEELRQLREDASDVEHAEAVLEVLGLDDSQDPVAAAKALREENERLKAENHELRAEITRLRKSAE